MCALVQRALSVVEDVPARESWLRRGVAWRGGEGFWKAKGRGDRRSVKIATTRTTTTINPRPSSSIGAGLSVRSLGTVTLVGSETKRAQESFEEI